ncbi:hypothetical protein [Wenjunlia tyrosinilytica]|uniref:Uncharacterized protein n=1 Tax=Wenjunlia tyrosinilytica TaxID=1544741 RepID=A0A917ZUM9_9ACTN|nr:hypothetical protein [Wenjunlia tyrosinilytica]GGO94523.1 hypothetical protein GCM10012280_49630 [Wenjunlia tyrosinilytica]
MDAALTAATAVAAIVLGCVTGALVGSAQAVAAGRNTAFLIGMMLCARTAVGQAAVMVPVAWLVVVLLFGFRIGRDPYPWTILPEPAHVRHAIAGSTLMFGLGIAAQLHASRKTS